MSNVTQKGGENMQSNYANAKKELDKILIKMSSQTERMERGEKLSKKEQKKLNAEKRKTWGDLKPITKVKPSAKLYNRKKKQDLTSYSKLNPVFVLSH